MCKNRQENKNYFTNTTTFKKIPKIEKKNKKFYKYNNLTACWPHFDHSLQANEMSTIRIQTGKTILNTTRVQTKKKNKWRPNTK